MAGNISIGCFNLHQMQSTWSREKKQTGSLNYGAAIEAYRNFDKKWGFDHTSGKTHTIFAYYDISYSMFRFLENHPMSELRNTDNFKKALRACLLAGLMRGTQSSYELAADFKMICDEQINCPSPLKLFDYDRMVIREMQRQIEFPQTARLNIISPMCFIYAGRPIVNGNPRTHRQLTNRRRAL